MKILVYGPERRMGALVGERVIDLNGAMTRHLQERGEANAVEQAATRLPAPRQASAVTDTPLRRSRRRPVDDRAV